MLDIKELKNITIGSTVRIETSTNTTQSNIQFGVIHKVLSHEDFSDQGHMVLLDDKKTAGRVIEVINFVPSNTNPDLELISNGENDKVEFKETFSFDVSKFNNSGKREKLEKNEFNIPKTVCGFANGFGGILFIGIQDRTGKIMGLERDYEILKIDSDGFENKIKMTLRKYFGEEQKWIFKNIRMKMIKIEGKDVFKIRVTNSKTPFIISKKVSTDEEKIVVPLFFIRTGNGTENFIAQNFIDYWLTHIKKI